VNKESIQNIEGRVSKFFPIVAIGASAGGLEAINELLKNLSPITGMAFIFVQHLSPDHKSLLTDILTKSTSMKVREVENKVKIEPNNFYIIPPDKEITVDQMHIFLAPRSKSSKENLPIDVLFSSLAKSHQENVIGIILSGNAGDGTRGMKSIKHEGGITFAQDDSAKYGSMPKTAIGAGVVDLILPPKAIASELNRLSKHPFLKAEGLKRKEFDFIDNNHPDLQYILGKLHQTKGVNFYSFKTQTIKRRIASRILMNNLKNLEDYRKLIDKKNEELDILFQALLINVVGFKYDKTDEYLEQTLFPKIINEKRTGESCRIWIPECSTGEEAFSLAMILLELQEKHASQIIFQIFATDLNEKAIQKARLGFYTPDELKEISPKRLRRFFTKSEGGYRIDKSIHNICVFASHNLLKDPPFSKLDFISCLTVFRNLDTAAQKRIVSTFHFALRENGYLMLGNSETISSFPSLFTVVSLDLNMYARKNNKGNHNHLTFGLSSSKEKFPYSKNPPATLFKTETDTLVEQDKKINDLLISKFLPPCVVINDRLEIIQFRGPTEKFLSHAHGKASFNILKMAHPEIAFRLRKVIWTCKSNHEPTFLEGIELDLDGEPKLIRVEVMPLDTEGDEELMLVMFTERSQIPPISEGVNGTPKEEKPISVSDAKSKRIKQLEEALAEARRESVEYSQEQEGFIGELQNANEEVISSNEELLTLNRELEISREDIESANEELRVINQELSTRNDLLMESYQYSDAIISNIHEPLIILDNDLRVKTANSSFYKKFGVTEEQTEGVLLFDLGNKQWNIPKLRELLEEIVPENSHFENFEVAHTFPLIGEKVLLLNARRILQQKHGEHLILLSFNDITELVRLQRKEKEALTREIKESKFYSQKLEVAVQERTKQLNTINISLEDKNQELENSNKELEAFTYISSHDLQEPLRKIQAFAGRLLHKENQNLTEKGQNYFRIIQKSAERMQTLIRDLLTFSQINKAEREFETIQLNELVEDVKIEYIESIKEKNAVIKTAESCEIRVIPFLFRQVIQNLVSNSLKYAQPDIPPQIHILCQKAEPEMLQSLHLPPQKEFYHISIKDNGIGFEQIFSERIFKVFEKLHSKDQYPGTGIGLAIVQKIIENHNGHIFATSIKNEGTTFDIYLPEN
jgi:two-component system, chemotaxis family, CheB/CheR fusion protein